jgi:large subunit ribosomal protein L17
VPHQTHLRTFGRPSAHRRAMLRNLTLSVLRYERVKTTEAKAKEVRRLVDRMIGLGKEGTLAARRRATAFLYEPEIVEKLFDDLRTRYPDRGSGYTRITHLGRRVGDSAPVMLIELMPGVDEAKAADAAAEEAAKPRRRLRIPRRAAKAEAEAAEPVATKAAEKKTTAKKTTRKTAKTAGS